MECIRSPEPGNEVASLIVAVVVVMGSVGGAATFGIDMARAASNDTNVVEGTPDLNASAPDARLSPGQDGTIGITLTNDAKIDDNGQTHPQEARRRAGEARSIEVKVSDTRDAPITVETGQQSVGSIQDGQSSGPHTFNVHVDEGAEAGTYTIEVTTTYRHAKRVEYQYNDYTESYEYNETVVNGTETETVTVVIEPEARFNVTAVDHNVPLGGEGIVSVEMENTGDENVTESTVSLTSSDSDFYFGSGTATSEAKVGIWKAGETKRLRFRARTVEAAVERSYPIDVSVNYRNSDDNQASDSHQIGITPHERTRFEVTSVEHDVPQNGEGTVTVTIQHTAGKEISDVSVTASTRESELYMGAESSRSATAMVGTWEPSETRQLTFRVGTTENAVDREYPIELGFDYTDANDNENSRTEYIDIRPLTRDKFDVESIEHDVPRNGEGTLTVVVDYTGSKDISDVSVRAATDESEVYLSSASSRSATSMVDEWESGETRRLRFRVGTTENALARKYPLEMNFDYTDDADNDNQRRKFVEFVPHESDHFAVGSVNHTVPRDGVGTVTVEITHTAENPITDVSVTASTQESEVYLGSESSRSATAMVGKWGPNETRRLAFRVGTTQNAVNRTYPLELNFDYTDNADNDNQRTKFVEFQPKAQPQFAVESVDSNVPIGGTGLVKIALTNEGPLNASEATLSISSSVDAVFFGSGSTSEPIEARGFVIEQPRTGTPNSQAYIGDWPVGATRTVYFRAGFDTNAITRKYVADLTVSYENAAGNDMPDQSRSIGIEPRPNQTFDFEAVESNLHVGEEGSLVGRITNVGNRTADGLVVTAENQRQNVKFYRSRYAIGTLEPGESATFHFRIGVTEETEHGPRLFELSARYRDPQGNVRQTDTQDLAVDINPDRDTFGIATERVTFSPGSSGKLVVTVTNRRNETLTDVQAKLFTEDPLDSSDDSAFIPELEPGESKKIVLDVSVADSATQKTYSASMDFRFDNARGESELSDTYRVPVTVENNGGDHNVPLLLGVFATVIGSIAVSWRFEALDRYHEWYREQFGN